MSRLLNPLYKSSTFDWNSYRPDGYLDPDKQNWIKIAAEVDKYKASKISSFELVFI